MMGSVQTAISADDWREVSHRRDAVLGRPKSFIAFYLDDLRGGGIQKMRLKIAGSLVERGHKVDLVVCDVQGPLRSRVPDGVRVVELEPSPLFAARVAALASAPPELWRYYAPIVLATDATPTLPYFPALVRYLRNQCPDAFCAATPLVNVEASLACRKAGSRARIVVSEHNNISHGHPLGRGMIGRLLPPMNRRVYERADALIAVSNGVAEDMAARMGLPRERITTVYNPTVTPEIARRARESLDHPWFVPGNPPVVLGVGRLSAGKDFATLVRAFARVRSQKPARLMILGEAKNPKKTAQAQSELMELAAELDVADDVALPGFVENPYAYLARASVYVMSSLYGEGLPNAVIEALACGCPVVSTDCPSGPSEILEQGRYGRLVPVRDIVALANAILETIDTPPNRDALRARSEAFSIDRAVDCYEALLTGATFPTSSALR